MAGGKHPPVCNLTDGEETVSRPRRAFRLMEDLGDVGGEKPDSVRHALVSEGADASASGFDDASPRGFGAAILSVTPEGEGESLSLVLRLPSDGKGDMPPVSDGKQRARKFRIHLLVDQYAELREEGISLVPGPITGEEEERLLACGRLCAAIHRGLGMLAYGDRSARRLTAGLVAKGVERGTAEEAAAYLARKGYLHEEETARLRVQKNLRKGWGPRRIREDLWAGGFDPSAREEALEILGGVDFSEACAEMIQKKYGEPPADREESRKMTAALMRQGYDMEHIREAVRLLRRGKN